MRPVRARPLNRSNRSKLILRGPATTRGKFALSSEWRETQEKWREVCFRENDRDQSCLTHKLARACCQANQPDIRNVDGLARHWQTAAESSGNSEQ